jgi:hypothetical protein
VPGDRHSYRDPSVNEKNNWSHGVCVTGYGGDMIYDDFGRVCKCENELVIKKRVLKEKNLKSVRCYK